MTLALINQNTSEATIAMMLGIASGEAGARAQVTGYTASLGALLAATVRPAPRRVSESVCP